MAPELIIGLGVAPWIIFALLSAFGDALVGFVDESLLHSLHDEEQKSLVDAPGRLLLISGFFGAITALAVFGYLYFFESQIAPFTSYALSIGMLAGCLEVLWLLPYFIAIDKSGALDATPILQSIPIFAGIFGVALFNDTPTSSSVVGALIIIAGAVMLNYSPRNGKIESVTIWLMFIASAIAALQLFIFKAAAEASSIPYAIAFNGIGMFAATLSIWLFWKPFRVQFNDFCRSASAKVFLLQAVNESLYTISAAAGQIAVVLGPSVMVASAIGALHPIFTLLIAVVLASTGVTSYRERLNHNQWYIKIIAIGLITFGAYYLLSA